MKYIKKFESRYTSDSINKKYYIWKLPNPYSIGNRVGIIQIVKSINKQIYYDIVEKTGGYKDFFTQSKYKYQYPKAGVSCFKVSLSYWKSRMLVDLLFETDDLNDAKLFYKLYNEDNSVNRDNFEIYKDTKKFNI